MKKRKGKATLVVHPNLLNKKYVTNENQWCVDETYISNNAVVFLVLNLKTRCIVGAAVKYLDDKKANFPLTSEARKRRVGLTADEVLEVYNGILVKKRPPAIIHSDTLSTYTAKSIKEFADFHSIKLSTSIGSRHDNQVIESINNRLKTLILVGIDKRNNTSYKKDKKFWPLKFKNVTSVKRAANKEFRDFIFNSDFISKIPNLNSFVFEAIDEFNRRVVLADNGSFTREQAEAFTELIEVTHPRSALSGTVEAYEIKDENKKGLSLSASVASAIIAEEKLDEKSKMQLLEETKVLQSPLDLGAKINKLIETAPLEQVLILEAVKLTIDAQIENTQKLADQNKYLSAQLNTIYKEGQKVGETVEELKKYKDKVESVAHLKKLNKEKRLTRIIRPKTQPFLNTHLEMALDELSKAPKTKVSRVSKVRTQAALVLFSVTGLRISEIRTLTVKQVFSLLYFQKVKVDRLKNGPKQYTAFLTKHSIKILRNNAGLIEENLFLIGIKLPEKLSKLKELDVYENAYFFSPGSSIGAKPLTRSHFTDGFNKTIQNLDCFIELNLNFTSHSLRHGFISTLWKNTHDLQFVSIAIGHRKIESTTIYAQHLSEEERYKRFQEITEETK